MASRSPKSPKVDAYIADCPPSVRPLLETVRAVIRAVAPDATEVVSYQMPGYSYEGYDYKGMFAWFGLQSRHVGLYLRPPTVADFRKELKGYSTTKSAVHLPLDYPVPEALIRKLVRASLRNMKARGRRKART